MFSLNCTSYSGACAAATALASRYCRSSSQQFIWHKYGRVSSSLLKCQRAHRRTGEIVNPQRKPEVITVGDYVWRSTYDLYARGHLPMPEMSGAVLKQFLKVH